MILNPWTLKTSTSVVVLKVFFPFYFFRRTKAILEFECKANTTGNLLKFFMLQICSLIPSFGRFFVLMINSGFTEEFTKFVKKKIHELILNFI